MSVNDKVIIQSRDSVIQVLAEVLATQDNMSAKFIKSDLWFFDNVCFKTQKALIDAALKIIDNVESVCFFNDQRKIWNPDRDLTYRDTYEFLSNPNACVRLIVKDALCEFHEVEISAYGSIRIGCDFKSIKFDRGVHETGNSL